MKFSPKEDILKDKNVFEAGNTYDNDKYGVSSESVMNWYNLGLTEVEGKDPAPERQTTSNTLNVQNSVAGQKSTTL